MTFLSKRNFHENTMNRKPDLIARIKSSDYQIKKQTVFQRKKEGKLDILHKRQETYINRVLKYFGFF